MITLTLNHQRRLLLGMLLVIVCFAATGCEFLAESKFTLADESNLPKWVALPPGLTRADVLLTMSYYIMPWGRSARFILQDKHGQVLAREDGKLRCREPFQLKTQESSKGYPAYEPITINGITEIIEHRKMEPIFYVTDNPAVWKQYRSIGCGG